MNKALQTSNTAFKAFSHFTLVYNLGVILWGAFVRASGSGAGCGAHWPLCNGVVAPVADSTEMLIEFSHRITSGLALVFVLVLFVWSKKSSDVSSTTRYWSKVSFIFIVIEALIGASLVLLKLVANDASSYRAVVVAAHLVNSFLLIGSLSLISWTSEYGDFEFASLRGKIRKRLLTIVCLFLTVASAGAVTALGDTLFPSASLAEGIAQDLSIGAHFLIRLRVIHPLLAVVVTLWIVVFCTKCQVETDAVKGRNLTAYFATVLKWLLIVQIAFGFVNLLLLAPIWAQIIHLAFACLTWLSLVALLASIARDLAINPKDTESLKS